MSIRRKIKKLPITVLVIIILALGAYIGLSYVDHYDVDIGIDIDLGDANFFALLEQNKDDGDGGEKQTINEINVPVPEDGEIMYHFIDVGQGDAILITTPDGNMLIDTSIKSVREDLDSYLKAAGVERLEYLVLTHPDADHIGNADYIIQTYEIGTILLPDCASTSKTYERMLDAMENSDAKVVIPEVGYTFNLGALTNTVLAPIKEYDDPNEMSIVIKSVYGEISVMLTGDAEVESEGDMVEKWDRAALDCDILKVGHHGSRTSSTDAFLAAVSPRVAVISCGEGNSYGHPHTETVERLEDEGIACYRTDLNGTVVITTNGEDYEIDCERD